MNWEGLGGGPGCAHKGLRGTGRGRGEVLGVYGRALGLLVCTGRDWERLGEGLGVHMRVWGGTGF